MSRIEDELRNVLSAKFEEGMGVPPSAVPTQLRRRVRMRQSRGVFATALAATAVGIGVFAGIRAVQPSPALPGTGIVRPSPSTTYLRDEDVQAYVLTTDERSKNPWKVLAYATFHRGLCLAVVREEPTQTSGSCDFTVPGERPMEASVSDPQLNGRGPRIVFGAVAPSVAEVVIRLEGGRGTIGAKLLALPRQLDAPFNAFVAKVPAGTDGIVAAIDSRGRTLASEPLGPPPPNFQPGDLIGAVDRYGNHVGYLPYEYLEPADAPGAWSPPGSPADVNTIRTIALSGLKVRAGLRKWWKQRPDPSEPDAEFMRWWNSYPIHQEIPEPTPS